MGPGNIEVLDVQPVVPATNFGEKAALAVLNPQDNVLNQHLGASLVQLAHVDDAVL